MAKFKKCPRCDINYIPIDQEYCEICTAEMKGIKVYSEDFDELEPGLCPKCKQNYLNDGEKICASCALEAEKAKSAEQDEYTWKETDVVVDAEDIELPDDVSLDLMAEEEFDDEEETFEDEENSTLSDDDEFAPVDVGDDYDEDEDEDEEEDDDEF